MSKESWREKFYAERATSLVNRQGTTAADFVKHSITKWEGLTEESLKEHGILVPSIDISNETCALCLAFETGEDCSACPLARIRSGTRCDQKIPGTKHDGPFTVWAALGDAEPMIKALKKALALIKRSPAKFTKMPGVNPSRMDVE